MVGELQRLMWAHFRMSALPDDTLAGLPQSHITAQLKPSPLDAFEACWAHGGILCSVERSPGQPPKLRMHLSLVHPVAAPLTQGGMQPASNSSSASYNLQSLRQQAQGRQRTQGSQRADG